MEKVIMVDTESWKVYNVSKNIAGSSNDTFRELEMLDKDELISLVKSLNKEVVFYKYQGIR